MCPAFPLYSIAPANLLEHGSHISDLLHIYFIFQPLLRHVLSYILKWTFCYFLKSTFISIASSMLLLNHARHFEKVLKSTLMCGMHLGKISNMKKIINPR